MMRVLTDIHGAVRLSESTKEESAKLPDISSAPRFHREEVRIQVAKYISRCEEAIMRPIDIRIKRYLEIIPDFMPISTLMIGQEPYKPEILPYIASAFAFNPHVVDGYTPTVQVLGQMITVNEPSKLREVMDIMTCSYSILPRGVCCLNVTPFHRMSDQETLKARSYFADFISTILASCAKMGCTKLSVICLGDVAKQNFKICKSSTPKLLTRTMKIEKVYLHNPVFMSRTKVPKRHDKCVKPSAICKDVHDFLTEGDHVTTTYVSASYTLAIYSKWDVFLMGSLDSLASAFQHVEIRDIDESKSQIIAAVPRRKSSSISMPSYQAPRPPGPNDFQVRAFSIMSRIDATANEIKEEMTKTCEAVKEALADCDSPEALAKLKCLDDLVCSCGAAVAFLASINPSLTAASSHVDATSPTVTPIIKTRAIVDEHIDFSSLLSNISLKGEAPASESMSEEEAQEKPERKKKKKPGDSKTGKGRKMWIEKKKRKNSESSSSTQIATSDLEIGDTDDYEEDFHEYSDSEQDEYDLLSSGFNVGMSGVVRGNDEEKEESADTDTPPHLTPACESPVTSDAESTISSASGSVVISRSRRNPVSSNVSASSSTASAKPVFVRHGSTRSTSVPTAPPSSSSSVSGSTAPVIVLRRRNSTEYRRIIGEILIPPSVIIRKEYSTFEEAEKARLTDGLSSDGVVIIEKNTSITYRIKKPTIDLLCYRGDMQILLQGRRRMHACAGLPGMKSGTIYECNVEPDGEDNLRVVRAIPRTDKMRPNSRSVLSTVLALLRSTDDVDYTLIDRVSSYSFRVREYIYRRMENMGVKSGFTVDIGSGDLSSWINVTDLDSESMARGRVKRAYYRESAESLFSIDKIVEFLRIGGHPVVIGEDGVLIDLGRISMKMHPDKPGYAVAKYGSKVEYVESAVRTRDFRATKMSYATDVIYGDCEIGSDTLRIVRNILVVSSF
ncbi:unnamed protein product [Peronospora belbahrii]|uniref:Uncharacterized protein n=1 Tax=Peronospora belbahrii TaxID=622444 RepID=A0ABN8CN95_9STRA|nr:unnamed protein product [Peronospora belbahrii]